MTLNDAGLILILTFGLACLALASIPIWHDLKDNPIKKRKK